MIIEDRTTNVLEEVKLSNNLIEKAFGKGWKGNYDLAGFGPDIRLGETTDKLLLLAKKSWYSSLFDIPGGLMVGQLGADNLTSDGSVIAIKQKYINQAKEYVRLYEQTTGISSKVIIIDEIDLSKDFGFIPKK